MTKDLTKISQVREVLYEALSVSKETEEKSVVMEQLQNIHLPAAFVKRPVIIFMQQVGIVNLITAKIVDALRLLDE